MTSESSLSERHPNRGAIIGLAIVLVLVAATYLASPLAALYALRSAVQTGDKDRLDALVDFPAIRDDLKSQLNARILEAMNKPDMKDNPFGGLAAVIAPALLGRVIDAAVTPDGLSTLVRDGKVEQTSDQQQPTSTPTATAPTFDRMGYLTLDRFKASFANKEVPPARISLVLERRGVFTWKLIKIELPADALPANLPVADDAQPTPAAADQADSSPAPSGDLDTTLPDNDAAAQRQYEEERRLQRIRDHDARVSCYTHGGPPC